MVMAVLQPFVGPCPLSISAFLVQTTILNFFLTLPLSSHSLGTEGSNELVCTRVECVDGSGDGEVKKQALVLLIFTFVSKPGWKSMPRFLQGFSPKPKLKEMAGLLGGASTVDLIDFPQRPWDIAFVESIWERLSSKHAKTSLFKSPS